MPMRTSIIRTGKSVLNKITHVHMDGFWDVTARVFWKGGIHVCHCETYLHIILIDEEGSKIECLSFGEQCINYIQSLREGQIYDFTSVCFRPTDDIYLNHLWTLRSDYYVHLSQSTDVRSCQRCVNISLCPPSFLEFGNICVRCHNTFTDVIGVVVYVSRGQEGLNFRRRPNYSRLIL